MNNIKKSAENLQKYGRNGDTLLAHITPAEANLLKAFGGSGTINPTTGLPEYFFGGFFSGISDFFSNTLGSVADVVENQIQEIVDDPIKAAAKVAAVASGNAWALPIIEGVDTIEEGGSIEEGLLSAGKAYVGQQVGAELGSQFGSGGYGTGEDFNMGEGGYYTGEDFNMGVSLGDADIQPGGFYGGGSVPQATILPGELGDIILDANGNIVTSSGSDILPGSTGFNISPMQALQGLRGASGLLGRQQQPQAIPQMQMGSRTQMPQGAVDYSGIYNLLALQRARNPNSLLG